MLEYTYGRLEHHGRLGNQLWQIASTIGRASKDAKLPIFKPDWEYRRYFKVPDEFFGGLSAGNFADFSLPVDGYTDYMQRFGEFSDMEDCIRSMFQPSDLSVVELKNRWPYLYQSDKPRIALHVRRGDYTKHLDLFPPPTPKYYSEALNVAQSDLGVESEVLVFSDDIPWCRENFSEDFTFVEGIARPVEVRNRKGQPEDQYDLFLMADCDKHIIANSSYSWWGAFLSEKDKSPFYPSIWFGKSIPEYPVWRKMIPSTWRQIEC